MKIALIIENSQAAKSDIVHRALTTVAEPLGHEVFHYGMYTPEDAALLTYPMNGLLAGILAGQTFDSELTGDASLSKRPMERVAKPLRQMGAVIQTQEGGVPPVRVLGQTELRAIDYDMPVASAQVKSSLLLAGLYAEGVTRVTEPAPTRGPRTRYQRYVTRFGVECGWGEGHLVPKGSKAAGGAAGECGIGGSRRRYRHTPTAVWLQCCDAGCGLLGEGFESGRRAAAIPAVGPAPAAQPPAQPVAS